MSITEEAMSRPRQLSQWTERLASHLPSLSLPQIRGLAGWSFAVAVCSYCGLSRVALFLSMLCAESEAAIRERLRDVYRPAGSKAGARRGIPRCELDVAKTSGELLRWCAGGAEPGAGRRAKRLVVALDATNLGERFLILSISVVCRGGAVPIAWRVLPANQPGEWTPHWQELLGRLAGLLGEGDVGGEGVTVIALTDRGLQSTRLFQAIQDAGFHPLMRLRQKSSGPILFRPAGWKRFYPLERLGRWGRLHLAGELYKTNPLACHLLIQHDPAHEEPWILATDLPSAKAAWYAFRAWIEQGFKDIKRGGFHWQRTRMQDPKRVERFWLVLALALLWTLEVGAALEALEVGSHLPPASRQHSVAVRGQVGILAALIAGPLQPGSLPAESIIMQPPPLPEDPWPTGGTLPPPITEHDLENQQETYT
jgi:hypothetical protein